MSDEILTAGRRRRHRGAKRSRSRRSRRGGGYGFEGSILADAGGTNAGAAQWKTTVGECGTGDNIVNRGGNNTIAGGRRRRRHSRRGGRKVTRRHRRRGGGGGSGVSRLAFQSPRIAYGFNGTGAGGLANAVPINGNSVSV